MASAPTPTILTVSGLIGSGKTSVCRELSALTGWRVVSAGTILRRMAEERHLSLIELNEIAKTDGSIDKFIDDQLKALGDSPDPLIVDSRLAWHFIPNSYKIHLVVDTAIAAQRVFSANRTDESYADAAAAYTANAQRQEIENVRFQQYYGIDCENWCNYDLILDSSTLPPAELAQKIHEALAGPAPKGSCWLSPSLASVAPDAKPAAQPGFAVRGPQVWVVEGPELVNAAEPLVYGRLLRYEAGSRNHG